MNITEKTPIGLVSSHSFGASLFFRVTSLYMTFIVYTRAFPLKTKSAPAILTFNQFV